MPKSDVRENKFPVSYLIKLCMGGMWPLLPQLERAIHTSVVESVKMTKPSQLQ